jgi:hypothetical protein
MKWAQLLWLGVVALGLGGGFFPGVGFADEMPCTTEIQAYCADVQPGGGRILNCLKQSEAKLSPACVMRIADFEQAWSGALGACRDDWAAYCYHPRAATDRQGIVECLQTNRTMLSSPCQKALQGAGRMERQRSRGMTP